MTERRKAMSKGSEANEGRKEGRREGMNTTVPETAMPMHKLPTIERGT